MVLGITHFKKLPRRYGDSKGCGFVWYSCFFQTLLCNLHHVCVCESSSCVDLYLILILSMWAHVALSAMSRREMQQQHGSKTPGSPERNYVPFSLLLKSWLNVWKTTSIEHQPPFFFQRAAATPLSEPSFRNRPPTYIMMEQWFIPFLMTNLPGFDKYLCSFFGVFETSSPVAQCWDSKPLQRQNDLATQKHEAGKTNASLVADGGSVWGYIQTR